MKLHIKGRGDVNLTKRDFLGSGGEGSVYVKGSQAFKIYNDPSRMIPEQKIEELARIQNRNVIKPEAILTSSKNKPVGYTMQFVDGGYPLCQVFTKAFKARHNLGLSNITDLIQEMRVTVESIHQAGILVVDMNEMNCLVSHNFRKVLFIDVDSYQTPSFPATAIMDSIRDWNTKKWSKNTDWFSWAIITFQMFMGIHPYKGKHSSIKNMIDRMKTNTSIFNPSVTVPKMVPSLDTIPEPYQQWYNAVFETGLRGSPPAGTIIISTPLITKDNILSTAQLKIIPYITYKSKILKYEKLAGVELLLGENTINYKVGGGGFHRNISDNDGHFGLAKTGEIIYSWIRNGWVQIKDLKTGVDEAAGIRGQAMMSYGGRLYIHNGEHILELGLLGTKNGFGMVTSKQVANVMPNATKLFNGVAIQNILGTWYASVFPKPGSHYQFRLDEFEKYKLVDAKFDGRVLIVIGTKNGKYDKFVYRTSSDYSKSSLFWKDEDIQYIGINFVVLDNGICVHINEKEELVLFTAFAASNKTKTIRDSSISGDMNLFRNGSQTLLAHNNKLFKLNMKKDKGS